MNIPDAIIISIMRNMNLNFMDIDDKIKDRMKWMSMNY